MALRDYQDECLAAVVKWFGTYDRQLISLPTGTGKGYTGAYLAALWPELCAGYGRGPNVLWMANRDELVWQAANDLRTLTGKAPGIEKASETVGGKLHNLESHCVVSSVQTLMEETRLRLYSPDDFGLVVFDEAQHGVSPENRRVLNYFTGAKLVGMTATTDRTDEVSLGEMFQHVPYHMDILDAVLKGWLVKPMQQLIEVPELDWSELYESNDVPLDKLESIIKEEAVLHRIALPAAKMICDRPTLVFCPRIQSAQTIVPVLQRYIDGKVAYVHGSMPIEERREEIEKYRNGDTQVLASANLILEGFDAPPTACIVMARPTKSRMLYAQAIGRGLRPLKGTVDGLETAEERLAAIATSGKPDCLVIDLVGVSRKHSLIQTVDLLGGKMHELVREEAKKWNGEAEEGCPKDVLEALLAAAAREDDLRAKERQRVVAEAKIKAKTMDPFAVFPEAAAEVEPGWWENREATEEQLKELESAGIKSEGRLTHADAAALIREKRRRAKAGLCSFKQAKILQRLGLSTSLTADQAAAVMTYLSSRPKSADGYGGWANTGRDHARKKKAASRGRLFDYYEVYQELTVAGDKFRLPRLAVKPGIEARVRKCGGPWVDTTTKNLTYFDQTDVVGQPDGQVILRKQGHELAVPNEFVVDLTETSL